MNKMDDIELVERYFRGELSSDEITEFDKRLSSDASFKELFEVESVLFKSLQYSSELERIKELAVDKESKPKISTAWLKSYSLWYASGAALSVWIITNILSGILHIDAELIKWVGFTLAFILAAVLIIITDKKFNFQSITISTINALLIFVISSGIDAINQGVESQEKEIKATLIPFTKEKVWWPTRTLVDSVVQQQKVNQELKLQNKALNTMLISVRDSCFKSTFNKIVPIVVPGSSSIIAGGNYEADVFAAPSYLLNDAEITIDGKLISMEIDPTTGIKVGKIKFKTSGANYDSTGISKLSYQVGLNIPGSLPMNRTIEYKVIKPLAKFETESASTLYLDCGNEISVSISGLAESSGISLSVPADQGKVIKQGNGKFVLIPSRPQIDVSVSINGNPIEIKQFNAKAVPLPKPKLMVGNSEYDVIRGIPPGTNVVSLVPEIDDETFKRQNAKDAGYRITGMTLAITGRTPINLSSGTIELNKYGLRAGDSFSIYNVQVVRSTWDPDDADNKPVNAKLDGSYVIGK